MMKIFLPVLAVLLIGLKLTGLIAWSWLWVLCPLWIGLAFGIFIFLLIFIFWVVKYVIDELK